MLFNPKCKAGHDDYGYYSSTSIKPLFRRAIDCLYIENDEI